MSSPAELLAAAHAAAAAQAAVSVSSSGNDSVAADDSENHSIATETETSSVSPASASRASINDESAFPALGTAPTTAGAVSAWGPKMKKPFAAAVGSSSSSFGSSSRSVPLRSKVIQEAFSLDFESQLNINKTEIASILNNLKKSTKCSIECTSSQQTKKRTFLITGEPSAIARARKEVIRRLTKPVIIEFTIPASSRSVVIGAGGKNLKPILESNGVKINIDREPVSDASSNDEDDIFGASVKVTIEGDIQGVNDAKAQILAIVDEHTKTLTTKFTVDSKVAPFIEQAAKDAGLTSVDNVDIYISPASGVVSISGPRETIVELRSRVKSLANDLIDRIITKEQIVPKKFHKFIDTEEIVRDYNVIVEVPFEEENSEVVKFIGDLSKIPAAINAAKQSSKKHTIESLNIARAHNANLQHGKYLGIYFKAYNVLDSIAQNNSVQIYVPSYKSLLSNAAKDVNIDFVFDKENTQANFKAAKKAVIDLVNQLAPTHVKLINDIDSFFAESVAKQTEELANKLSVKVIPFATLADSKPNDILLVSVSDDDDFGPSVSEINDKFSQIDESLNNFRELTKNVINESIEVPLDEQKHIVGPKGAVLRSLKASVNNPLDIIFQSPTIDEVTIHGLKDDVKSIIKEIHQVLQDAKDYAVASQYFTTLEFPTSVLSRLIGKSGAHLNGLSEEFGVKIDVAKAEDQTPSTTTAVKITGVKRNAEDAKTKIIQLGKRWADETTQTLNVPQKFQSRLIGAKGAYVNRLQDKYNVRIRFPQDGEGKRDEVVIKGPSKGVKKAHDELKDLLNYEIENSHKVVVTVPPNAVSRIIGKNGNNLSSLRDEYGVEIDIVDEENKEKLTQRQVEITGSKASIKEVEKKIKEIAKEVENTITVELEVDPKHYRTILGSNGSNLRAILAKAKAPEESSTWHRLLVIPDRGSNSKIITSTGDKKVVESIIAQIKEAVSKEENSITEEFSVPQEKHKLLIGPSGSTRRTIESDYNVFLIIPRISEKSDIIKVKGAAEDVAKAKEHIVKLTADNWNAAIDIPSKYHGALSQRGAVFKKLRNDFNVKVEHGRLTREASKLSSATPSISVPESAKGPDASGASYKWTVITDDAAGGSAGEEDKIIPWRFIGAEEDAQKAKKYIESQLESIKGFDATGYLYVNDRSAFSKVIGPKGSTVDKIRKSSSTTITIPQASDDVNDVIVIRGTSDGLEKAKDAILKIIK